MASAGVVHEPADLRRPLLGPFQLLGQLGDGHLATQLPPQADLSALVVLGRPHRRLAVADGSLLVGQRPVHADGDLPPAGDLEVGAADRPEAADGLHEAERALLEEVALAQPTVPALLGSGCNPVQVSLEQLLLGMAIPSGGGLEQTVWNPATGLFYQPVTGVADAAGNVITPGRIDVFDPRPDEGAGRRVASIPTPTCLNGPVGLTLAEHQRLVGACDGGGLVVQVRDFDHQRMIPNVGGADEAWYNPGDEHVYFARTGAAQLGVGDPEGARFIANLPTGPAAHSVAAYAANNHVFVPVSGGGIEVFADAEG